MKVSLELHETSERLDADFAEDQLAAIADLEAAISRLISERAYIESIPTWLCKTGAFRVAPAAVLLPGMVYVIQHISNGWFAF